MSGAFFDYGPKIRRALLTPGGHLSIGRGGATLYYDNSRLSGMNADEIKSDAIRAGLPVIDSRPVPFQIAACLAVQGPMVAVNRTPDAGPWHGFSSVPLAVVAATYRQVGADVHNIADCPSTLRWFAERPLTPLDRLLDDWLAHVLRTVVMASIEMETMPVVDPDAHHSK